MLIPFSVVCFVEGRLVVSKKFHQSSVAEERYTGYPKSKVLFVSVISRSSMRSQWRQSHTRYYVIVHLYNTYIILALYG